MGKISNVWVVASAISLGVVLTIGSLNLFATKGEVEKVAVSDRCGQVEYQIDKTQAAMWAIEDRYRRPDGNPLPMGPVDARRYRKLEKQLRLWEEYQKKWGCIPGKVGG